MSFGDLLKLVFSIAETNLYTFKHVFGLKLICYLYSTSKDQILELSKFNKDIPDSVDFDNTKFGTGFKHEKKESGSSISENLAKFRYAYITSNPPNCLFT